MSNVNKTGRPSLSPVIKPISSKPLNKTCPIQTTKPTNISTTQSTFSRHTNYSFITTSVTATSHTTTPSSSAPSPLATIESIVISPEIHTNNTTKNTTRNYAYTTATENSPSREQALVFNSIDGIPQREYVLTIGKIIFPKNIVFVSRISNRSGIFLSSKKILDSLLESTQTITINDQLIQMRRLVNPSKKIVISNVCLSIPNQIIIDALKNINITPMSQIVYLKAGINIEGYDHILSFCRQFHIKPEDVSKLSGSLSLDYNQTDFRVFFTDDRITLFMQSNRPHFQYMQEK
jgi:hypothetical protein